MGYVIGIDPGIYGGVALLHWEGSRVQIEAFVMPTTFMLTSMKDRLATVDAELEEEAPGKVRKKANKKRGKRKRAATGKKHLVDVEALQRRLEAFHVPLGDCQAVVIERVLPRSLEGRSSILTSGTMFGQLLGFFASQHIHPCLPQPTQWKLAVLPDTDRDKAAAIAYSQKHFPDLSLLASPRCRTPHDGLADAVCIAAYARRLVEEHRGQLRRIPDPPVPPRGKAPAPRGVSQGRGRRSDTAATARSSRRKQAVTEKQSD